MKLNVDKRFVKAGNIVVVEWDCPDGTSPRLVMHMGSRESELAVPPSGEKRFRLKGLKGKHWIGLRAYIAGKDKLITHRIFVYGRAKQADTFEYMDHSNSFFKRWKEGLKRYWNYYTPEKKRLYLLLLMLLAFQFINSLWPNIGQVVFYAIIFWLFWQVVKR